MKPRYSWTLAQLAAHLSAGFEGDPEFVVEGLKAPEEAAAQDLTALLDPQWLPQILKSESQCVLLEQKCLSEQLRSRQLLVVEHAREAFSQLLRLFYPEPELSHQISAQAAVASDAHLEAPLEIAPFVVIEQGVSIGANTRIGPHCSLGRGSRIGRDCRIGANVSLAPGTQLGDRVIIHAGSVLGADGYGFYYKDGRQHKIPQLGRVVIEDDVEIGANVTIDRGTLGDTVIGQGSKIDNQVQIGHNVRIGKHCLLVAQVGIAGSSELGDYVTLAGQTGVAGHLKIGSHVIAAGKSGITRNLPAGLKVSGFPAQDHRQELKQQAALRRLLESSTRTQAAEQDPPASSP